MKTQTGFTLIEVLIAMLILAVGLLGLAALQTATLRSNLAAYNHGQATQLLYDIADRMRTNTTAANSYLTSDTTAITTSSTPCTTSAPCTPTALATNDLIEWNRAIVGTLPMGRGRITLENGVFVLAITWDDDRSGAVTTDDSRYSSGGGTFTTYVTPVSGVFRDPIFRMSLQL